MARTVGVVFGLSVLFTSIHVLLEQEGQFPAQVRQDYQYPRVC